MTMQAGTSQGESATVKVERRGRVGVLSLNRPARHNAMDDATMHAFDSAWASLAKDPAVTCILLRGEGKSFCSGRDVAQLGHREGGISDFDFVRRAQDAQLMRLDTPKAVVAAVRGHALGGGFEIALSADIRIATPDAVFAAPEIGYGLLPDLGGTQLLTTLAGPSRAKYLVLTGNRIDTALALEWGIVDFVVPADQLEDRAMVIAAELAAKPPLAIAMGKQLVDQMHGESIRNGLRQELAVQTALFQSRDYQEARAAHREKRTPIYEGR